MTFVFSVRTQNPILVSTESCLFGKPDGQKKGLKGTLNPMPVNDVVRSWMKDRSRKD